jgi:dTMP kinase
MSRGKFIVFEGLDGAGTTTQARLAKDWLLGQGEAAYLTHEPSEGPAGLIIRLALSGRLLAPVGDQPVRGDACRPRRLDERTLALFFACDRLDHLQSTIIPRLEEGAHVISDRYYLSSFAYQSVELELDWVRELNKHCLQPDLTILLDVPVEICRERMEQERRHLELYEDVETLKRIRQNYLDIARQLRQEGELIHEVEGAGAIAEVHRKVRELLGPHLASGS